MNCVICKTEFERVGFNTTCSLVCLAKKLNGDKKATYNITKFSSSPCKKCGRILRNNNSKYSQKGFCSLRCKSNHERAITKKRKREEKLK